MHIRLSLLLPIALSGACSTTPGLLEGGMDEADETESESDSSESDGETSESDSSETDSSETDSSETDSTSDTGTEDACAACQVGELCVADVASDICGTDFGFTISCIPTPDIVCGDPLCDPACVEALCGPDHECVPECNGDPVDVWCGVNPFANNSCDPLVQDCVEGEKCVPIIEFGPTWDDNECRPIVGDGLPGEPCQVDDDWIDDCAEGSFCWASPGEMGFCQQQCTGDFACDVGLGCAVVSEGTVPICREICDPQAPQPCPDGESCIPAVDDEFVCAPALP